jgi:CBS domain-containing protein
MIAYLIVDLFIQGTTHRAVGQVFRHLGFVNWFLAGFNILPGLPLDGGRVFRALLWKMNKNFRAATQLAVRSGLMIALTLILTGMYYFLKAPDYGITGIWLLTVGLIIALMLGTTEGRNFGAWRVKRGTVEDVMKRDVVQVPPTMKVSDFVNKVLSNNHYTSFPVVDNRRLHGLLLLDELKSVPKAQWPQLLARDVMRPVNDAMFMNINTPLAQVASLLQSNGIGRAIVLDANGYIAGYVSLNDLAATR